MWQSCDYQSTCGGLNNTVRHRNTVQSLLNHQSYLKKREKQSKVGKFAKLVSHKSIGIEYEVTSWSLPGGVERESLNNSSWNGVTWAHLSHMTVWSSLIWEFGGRIQRFCRSKTFFVAMSWPAQALTHSGLASGLLLLPSSLPPLPLLVLLSELMFLCGDTFSRHDGTGYARLI